MKKIIKLFSSILICCIPIGLITYFAVPWKKESIISAAGSSSLQPLFTKFSDKSSYYNEYNTTTPSFNMDLIVQGGGSGFGIKSIATRNKDIGLASKNPYDSVKKATIQRNGFNKETWEKENIKTLTIGWDSIAIIYKSQEKLELSPTDGTLLKLYDLFSGNRKYRVNEIIKSSTDTSYFVPYGRTGGASASGTATSFMYESSFDWNKTYEGYDIDRIETALKTGAYLNNNVISTSESNVETWNKVKNENKDYAITYLSLSFALQNYNIIHDSGFNIAVVNGVDPVEYLDTKAHPEGLDVNFIQKYKWFSPYNIMISLNNPSEELKNFIRWIYLSDESLNIFKSIKLISLNRNSEYFKTMISKELIDESFDMTKDFDKIFDVKNSDVNLEKENPLVENQEYYYGIPRNAILKENK